MIGNNANFNNKNIKTGDDNNTITIGDDLLINNIETGNAVDTFVIGDDAVIDNLKSGDGENKITIGDGFFIDKLETKDGDDFVRLGDGGTIDNKLDGGEGTDTLSNGNEYTSPAIILRMLSASQPEL